MQNFPHPACYQNCGRVSVRENPRALKRWRKHAQYFFVRRKLQQVEFVTEVIQSLSVKLFSKLQSAAYCNSSD